MKTFIAGALLAAGVLALPGCVVHGHGHGSAVVITSGHLHSDHCGHYYWRGGWYLMSSHHHAHNCGHVYRGGLWIYDDGGPLHGNTVVITAGHVHHDACGHFYWRGGWDHSNGPPHGHGCGHTNKGGTWTFDDDDDKHDVKKVQIEEKGPPKKGEAPPRPVEEKAPPKKVEEKGPPKKEDAPPRKVEEKGPPKKEEPPPKKGPDKKGDDKGPKK